jgi:hypothetical protein
MDAAARAAARDQLLKDTNNLFRDGAYTPERSTEVMDILTKNNIGHDSKERQAIVNRLGQMKEIEIANPNGKKQMVPVPMALVKEALLGAYDEWFNMKDEGWANTIEATLKARMEERFEGTQRNMAGQDVPAIYNRAAFDWETYLSSKKLLADNPATGSVKKKK